MTYVPWINSFARTRVTSNSSYKKSTSSRLKAEVRRRFCSQSTQVPSPRGGIESEKSPRVTPLLQQLEEISQRMNYIRDRLNTLGEDLLSRDEAADLRQEQRELMLVTGEPNQPPQSDDESTPAL